jgi:hypothetical protein
VLVAADRDKVHEVYLRQLYGRGRTMAINGQTGIFSSVAADGRLELLVNGAPRYISSGSPEFPEEALLAAGGMP